MNVKPLNISTIRATATNAAAAIQRRKIEVARTVIAKQQYAGRWPEEYVSYSGPVGRNPFKNPVTFFGVMAHRSKDYAKRFTFLPISESAMLQLAEAAQYLYDIMTSQSWKYGIDTGLYSRSFLMYVRSASGRRQVTSFGDLDQLSEEAVFEATNAVSYASTIESNALNIAKIGGVLYFAAKQVQKRFPELGVNFGYRKAEEYGFGHKYDTPVVTIGSRKVVRDRLVRPGRRHRERAGIKRRLQRIVEARD